MPIHEESVAEINSKIRHDPSLLELKPHVQLGTPPSSYGTHHSHHSHSSHQTHHEHQYQPIKFRPTEAKEYQPSHHESEIIVGSSHSGSFTPSVQIHKPVIKIKKPEVKKIKLITPGLKHYATVGSTKFLARSDYANYLRSQHERREASQRMIQNMYRRSPRSFMMPQYAPESLNYDTSSD